MRASEHILTEVSDQENDILRKVNVMDVYKMD